MEDQVSMTATELEIIVHCLNLLVFFTEQSFQGEDRMPCYL